MSRREHHGMPRSCCYPRRPHPPPCRSQPPMEAPLRLQTPRPVLAQRRPRAPFALLPLTTPDMQSWGHRSCGVIPKTMFRQRETPHHIQLQPAPSRALAAPLRQQRRRQLPLLLLRWRWCWMRCWAPWTPLLPRSPPRRHRFPHRLPAVPQKAKNSLLRRGRHSTAAQQAASPLLLQP